MHQIIRTLLLFVLLLSLGGGALVWFSLDAVPLVETGTSLSHQDIARARQIITHNDPRRLKAGTRHVLALGENDLNLAANYLLRTYGYEGGSVRITLREGRLILQASTRLPDNPVNSYLNLTLVIEEDEGRARIAGLSIGRIPVPGRLADLALAQAVRYLFRMEDQRLFRDVVKAFSLSNGWMRVTYEWHTGLVSEAQARLIPTVDRERLRGYYEKLVEITRQPGTGRRPSLMRILQPLFEYARSRSVNSDPVAENRAAILMLAAYVRPGDLGALLPKSTGQLRPRRLILTLQRRQDLAEHFILSAALSAVGDVVLSDAVGLYKEITDSKGRSGFSFTDLAADRAGTRFGELATATVSQARRVQKLLARGMVEKEVMPAVLDLPEHMSEQAFKQRFGGVGSPAYRKLKQQIEQRIAACRLYQTGR